MRVGKTLPLPHSRPEHAGFGKAAQSKRMNRIIFLGKEGLRGNALTRQP